MKNLLPIVLIFSTGTFLLNSCATLSTAYVDDVYYNPETDNNPAKKKQVVITNQDDNLSSEYTGEYKNSEYTEGEYEDRIEKFHDEEYQGDYYQEDDQWNMSVNMGFSPYGSYWGVGFGYGYGYGYPYYGYPYYGYNYWYDPFYSYYPYYPYYGYYPPYYGECCGCYYPDYITDNNSGYSYGHRRGSNSNSGGSTINTSNINREASMLPNSGAATNLNSREPNANSVTLPSTSTSTYSRKIANVNEVLSGESKENNTDLRIANPANQTSSAIEKSDLSGELRSANNSEKQVNRTYTRVGSDDDKSTSKTRTGYTPSYTRASSSSTPTYNSSGNGSQSRNATGSVTNRNSVAGTSSGRNVNSNTPSSGTTYSAPAQRSSGTTYGAPTQRSSGSSYSQPSRSTNGSGSGNSAPRNNGSSYSAPRSGNSSLGSSNSAPNSSGSSSGSSYSAPRSSSGSSGSSAPASSGSSGSRRR